MPFGLINAPATFQRLMEYVLHDLSDFCIVYIDDILIYNEKIEEHEECVRYILERLAKHQLFVKLSKCSFFQSNVQFLGHEIGAGFVSMDQAKVDKVVGWNLPLKSAKEVKRFWGLVSWCNMFIPHLASIAAPLTALSSAKRKFVWTAEAEQAMKLIKEQCMNTPILLAWDPRNPTRVTTDASDIGIGAVLEQYYQEVWQPIEFWSRKLKPAETRYSVTDKEWLAVVEAVSSHWRFLLEGQKIIVRTDHKPLIGKLSNATSIPPLLHRHLRWIERLAPFCIEYQYISGLENQIADSLSRAPEFYAEGVLTDEAITLENAVESDIEYQQRANMIAKAILDKNILYRRYQVRNGVIYRPDNAVEVPNNAELINKLLEYNHDHITAGHFGRDRTLELLRRKWWWKGIAKDVEEYIKSCDKCQRIKAPTGITLLALQPIVAKRPWSIVTLDFVGSFTPAIETQHTECLVMVDKFTKMVHLAGCSKDMTAKKTAHLVLKHVICLHGVPEELISDRGPQFDSQVWKDI